MVTRTRPEAQIAATILMSRDDQTINMVIAALGGEGGGVLTNWLIAVAEQAVGGARARHLPAWPRERARRFTTLNLCPEKAISVRR